MESNKKLEKKYLINGEVLLETGMMIGASSSALAIGGTDKQVVRHPITKVPYIPGSSLKGKMRSLFELSRGQIDSDGKKFGPTQDPNHEAAQLFGHINRNKEKVQQPSRLIVRDGNLINKDYFKETELPYTEVKAENTIDRITAAANPRFFERVPRGARFELKMVLNVFDKETDRNGENFLSYVFDALQLVQDDYLGGSGSRGNGQVRFSIKNITEKAYSAEGGVAISDVSDKIPNDLKA